MKHGRKVVLLLALGMTLAAVAAAELGGRRGGSASSPFSTRAGESQATPAPDVRITSPTGTPTSTSTGTSADASADPPTDPDAAPTATEAVAAAANPAVGAGTVRMAFTGDALWHSPLWRQAQHNHEAAHGTAGYDFTPMLANLRPLLDDADVAVCHLETPIAPEGEELSTYPLFGVPAETIDAIAASGHTRCSAASNHTFDRGAGGVDRTVDLLEAAGLGVSGMARTPEEIEPQVFGVNGVTISHLSYTFGYNGLRPPEGEEWRSALIDPDRIVADAITARRRGADVVVVSMHWGVEGTHLLSAEQRDVANHLTASGEIDLIVGHHAHVLQPIEQVNGVWVVYGLGNIISNLPVGPQWPASSQDGAVVTVDVARNSDGSIDVSTPIVHPTWVDKDNGWIVRVVQSELADPATPDHRRYHLEVSLDRTMAVMGDYVFDPTPAAEAPTSPGSG